MSLYELALVTSDDLPEKDRKDLLDSIEKKVVDGKGQVSKVEEPTKKTLAYPIKKKETANFTFMEFEASQSVPVEVRKLLNLSEDVLRSLLIKKESPKIKKEKGKRSRKAKEE